MEMGKVKKKMQKEEQKKRKRHVLMVLHSFEHADYCAGEFA